VERWLLDGALLMNLFKAIQSTQSAEDEAAAVRLLAIMNRSRAPREHVAEASGLSETPAAPELPQ